LTIESLHIFTGFALQDRNPKTTDRSIQGAEGRAGRHIAPQLPISIYADALGQTSMMNPGYRKFEMHCKSISPLTFAQDPLIGIHWRFETAPDLSRANGFAKYRKGMRVGPRQLTLSTFGTSERKFVFRKESHRRIRIGEKGGNTVKFQTPLLGRRHNLGLVAPRSGASQADTFKLPHGVGPRTARPG